MNHDSKFDRIHVASHAFILRHNIVNEICEALYYGGAQTKLERHILIMYCEIWVKCTWIKLHFVIEPFISTLLRFCSEKTGTSMNNNRMIEITSVMINCYVCMSMYVYMSKSEKDKIYISCFCQPIIRETTFTTNIFRHWINYFTRITNNKFLIKLTLSKHEET